jgi:solute:Na+ symporter, SSS family
MSIADLFIFTLYIAGNIAVSIYLSKRIKNSSDFFAAGRQSPWWLSGLSAFMTMFSAGTFVVWGGIAFKYGMVAVSISTCLGISAFFVGRFLAGRWRKSGLESAAEFIHLRYGKAALHAYTWFNIFARIFVLAVALYSLSIILQALLPDKLNSLLLDAIGINAVNTVIIFCGVIIILYAIFGGLWAVLMTDVLQFVILMVSVLLVIPLLLMKIGGLDTFVSQAPDGFFSPVAGDFGWVFLMGWVVVHYLKIGGEWAFVQRYICVPTPKDARKAAMLFGGLYLISPLIWMLPPMMYRIVDPGANPEQAYILACIYALPNGLMGLMIASMFAATVSMIDSELNVFAGVLTNDFFKRIFPRSDEKTHVTAGRIFTFLLGAVVIWLAVFVPRMGGAEEIILVITAMLAGPTILPVLWGMYSHKISQKEVFITILGSGLIAIALKFGLFVDGGWLVSLPSAETLEWIQRNSRTLEPIAGTGLPALFLIFFEITKKTTCPHFINFSEIDENLAGATHRSALFPAEVIGITLFALSFTLFILALMADQDSKILFISSFILLSIGVVIFLLVQREKRRILAGEFNHKALK